MDRAEEDYWVVEAVTLGYENVLFPFGIVAIAALAGVIIAALELVHKSIGKI